MPPSAPTTAADLPLSDCPSDLDERIDLDADFAGLYDELRLLARRHLRRERAGHTLCTTGLVHESYLKLAALEDGRWRSRAQFFALASRAMRHILVDHARTRGARKRGGGLLHVTLHPEMGAVGGDDIIDLLSLDEALGRLGALDPRLEQVVECKFFGGLTTEETAEALGTSVRTVERDWTRARAHLLRLLSTTKPDATG